MKPVIIATICAIVLSGCTTASALEPIPGSITYGGQPRQKLTKSPVGSTFPHTFFDETGRRTEETYMIQPDRSLKLVERHYIEPPF